MKELGSCSSCKLASSNCVTLWKCFKIVTKLFLIFANLKRHSLKFTSLFLFHYYIAPVDSISFFKEFSEPFRMTPWQPNTLKIFNFSSNPSLTNYLSVFEHFVGLAFKGLMQYSQRLIEFLKPVMKVQHWFLLPEL